MRSLKSKLIVSLVSFSLFSALVVLSVCQWRGVDIYEASGARDGWWIGPFFNYLRTTLGRELSAILTLIFSVLPVYVAVRYWCGRV